MVRFNGAQKGGWTLPWKRLQLNNDIIFVDQHKHATAAAFEAHPRNEIFNFNARPPRMNELLLARIEWLRLWLWRFGVRVQFNRHTGKDSLSICPRYGVTNEIRHLHTSHICNLFFCSPPLMRSLVFVVVLVLCRLVEPSGGPSNKTLNDGRDIRMITVIFFINSTSVYDKLLCISLENFPIALIYGQHFFFSTTVSSHFRGVSASFLSTFFLSAALVVIVDASESNFMVLHWS